MSKLSQLKKDAYQSGKKRDWDEAVAIYERILELDKNNPTVINEMGDLCLKAGRTTQAVRHFLSAAAKYRQTGLLNNAVAIYKKILRYEGANLNAHWYLAETRASQGLLVEGENHGLHFLERSSNLSGDIKEIFLKRCLQLFELYPHSQPILERLVQVFHTWDLKLEAARAGCLLACGQWDGGDQDGAREVVEDLQGRVPELANYPEWTQWQQRVNPGSRSEGTFADFGAVDLGGLNSSAPAESTAEVPTEPPTEPPTEVPAEDASEAPAEEIAQDLSPVDDGSDRTATPAVEPAPPAGDDSAAAEDSVPPTATDDDGCIAIEMDDSTDFSELLGAATAEVTATAADKENEAEPEASEDDAPPVDLLAAILADDSEVLETGDHSQLQSITREIGAQVGGDGDDIDPSGLYDQGTVYLEMGMLEEACQSFARASESDDPSMAVRAREMWGVALQRADRLDEALDVMREGLAGMEEGSRPHLGMLYNLGKACEAGDRTEEAVAAFEAIAAHDPSYLDVQQHLADLATV